MIIDFALVALAFYFMIPTVAGYFAASYGRSFWLWFTISTFLPIVTHFILFALVYADEKILAKKRLTRRERMESDELVKDLMDNMEPPSIKKKLVK